MLVKKRAVIYVETLKRIRPKNIENKVAYTPCRQFPGKDQLNYAECVSEKLHSLHKGTFMVNSF